MNRGDRLKTREPSPKTAPRVVIFRGFGALKGQDEYGLSLWQEIAWLESEDTGRVLSLPVAYLEGFEAVR